MSLSKTTLLPISHIVRDPAPNAAQSKAITELSKDLVVSAGAGSGKTWVLTERYIEMLNHGTPPYRIIAITFTEKAAAEMKSRIRKAVRKRCELAVGDDELNAWTEMLNQLKRATITTIHGFCSRLLRDHPLEAGIDPQARVLDAVESGLLLDEQFMIVVEKVLSQKDDRAAQLYFEFPSKTSLLTALKMLYTMMRTHHRDRASLWDETVASLERRKAEIPIVRDRLLKELTTLADEVDKLSAETKKKPPQYLLKAQAWAERIADIAKRLTEWDGVMTEEWAVFLSGTPKQMWNRDNGRLRELRESVQAFFELLISLGEAPPYRQLLNWCLDIVEEAKEKYRAAKKATHAIDFNDLEELAVRLLENHPSVVAKWQSKLDFLMVDEFQDTNSLQKAMIDRISDHGRTITRFVVGDGKQSIYKFRGADVEVFQQIGKEIRQSGGEAIGLNENFRTQHRVIEYINSFFHFLMQPADDAPPFVVAYEALQPFRKPANDEAAIELLCINPDPPTDTEEGMQGEGYHFLGNDADALNGDEENQEAANNRELEAEHVADRIYQMVSSREKLVWKKTADPDAEQRGPSESAHPVQFGDIAILFSNKTHMGVYESALQQRGIPYIVLGGQSFYEKQEILDLVNLLHLLWNDEDEIALVGFLRSPFVHLHDETLFWLTRNRTLASAFMELQEKPKELEASQWNKLTLARHRLLSWRLRRQVEGLAPLLQEILEETGFADLCFALEHGAQVAANIEKFIELARRLVDQQGHDLIDFISFIETMREEEVKEQEAEVIRDRGDAVQLMTIHASKGLEFPVVFLPHLDRNLISQAGGAPRVMYHAGKGLALKLQREGTLPVGDGWFDALAEEEKQRVMEEEKRKLYVAMTRARDYLVLVATQKEIKNPVEELKNQWLDWIVKHLGSCVETSAAGALQLNELPPGVIQHRTGWSMKVHWAERSKTAFSTSSLVRMGEADSEESTAAKVSGNSAHSMTDFPLLSPMPMPMDSLPTYSVTAIMEYLRCPRAFYLSEIEGWDLEGWKSKVDSGNSALALTALQLGNIVHRVCEKLDRLSFSNQLSDNHEKQIKPIILWAALQEGLLPEQLTTVHETIRPYIASYLSSNWFHDIVSRQVSSVRSEISFHYRMEGGVLSGIIDKMLLYPDGTVTLMDFKTNRIADGLHGQEAAIKRAATNYLPQAYIYALVVEELLGRKVRESILFFLEPGIPFHVNLNRDLLQEQKRRMQGALQRIRQSRENPALFQEKCGLPFCLCEQLK